MCSTEELAPRISALLLGHHAGSLILLAQLFVLVSSLAESSLHPIWLHNALALDITQTLGGEDELEELGILGNILVDDNDGRTGNNDVAHARLELLVGEIITTLDHEVANPEAVIIKADGESAVAIELAIAINRPVEACNVCLRRCADIVEEAEPHGIAGIALLRNLEIGLVAEIFLLHIINI